MENLQNILDHLEQEHWWYQARRTIVATVIDSVTAKKNSSIASIGCGNGTELAFLETKGCVTGLDIDTQVVTHCRAKGFTVVQADLLNHALTEQFDIVVAMDIVEHIKDDQKAIRALYDLVKPGGSLIVTVPAFPFLWTELDELTDFPHHRLYTRVTLKKLLKKPGMTVTLCSYYNFFLFPLVLLTKMLKISAEKQLQLPHRFFNGVLYHIFAVERFFLRWFSFPWGGSLIAVIKKGQ
jgi:SAM-dependent methyltransferase